MGQYRVEEIENTEMLCSKLNEFWDEGFEVVSCVRVPLKVENGFSRYRQEYTLILQERKREKIE